ncbi:hypothetical protein Micbo1qcDRAFT_158931 [Microdochium bolleyi]|uniref:Magnesium transporter n=1 Tax=Microdochium bolleyi TaxID=196109 RepID=A0A136JAB2_9PEZI|nr:hypothetical protein Micbo1qcDRAFT_158931 [Microdochium bolleyi]
MASLRLRAPSPSLLRFLRSQSDQLGFSLEPTSASAAVAQISCAASRARRSTKGCLRTLEATELAPPRTINLQAGLLNLDGLLRPRATRQPKSLRSGRTPDFFTSAVGARWRSTGSRDDSCAPSWRERLFGQPPRRASQPLEPDDLPGGSSEGDHSSIFNSGRQLRQKAALEPRLRCTEVDEHGNAVLVDGEFKKSELIARFGLLPRDLRKIDSSNLPHILVRPSAILLNLLHLKVLIKYNTVLLFDVYGSKASYPQSAFMYDLQGKLQQKSQGSSGGLPYEFRALEAVLQSVTQELENDFEAVREPVLRILSELEEDIDRHKLRILLILSKRVSTFEQKAKLVRDAIDELLEADDDLASMYLTEKTHDLYRGLDDHTEVEMLLESYHKLCDEVVQEAQNLVSGIRNTEEIIRAILDANRNALMLLELKYSVGTLGLAMGTFIAGLYGMNLENFIEETNWGFTAVTVVSTVMSLWVCRYGLGKLRVLQRVKMSGDSTTRVSNSHNGHWFHDEGHAGLLDPRNREKLRRMSQQKTPSRAAGKKKWWIM